MNMNTDRQIKLLVRSLLVMASFWMVVGNMTKPPSYLDFFTLS